MNKPKVVILGAGPAGIGAAWRLAKSGKADVTVLEQGAAVGGNAGSFDLAGLRVDYGSHRLHPATAPEIMRDLQNLLGADLLERPRHGRIRLQNRWIHFPLKSQDLAFHLPLSFSAGVAFDLVGKMLPQPKSTEVSFTSVLEKGLGTTICKDFYFPYAKKVWGLAPENLSAVQAQKRVSAGSFGKMARKIFSVVPGFKTPGAGKFYYPRKGFGQISEAIAADAAAHGAKLHLNSRVCEIETGKRQRVTFQQDGAIKTLEADHLWSTIPLTVLAKITKTSVSVDVLRAAEEIRYRAMVLIYLVLKTPQWSEFDAHYFPEEQIKLTRLSEPKNYSATPEPANVTVLCGELPCFYGDAVWRESDENLQKLVVESLASCDLPIKARVLQVVTRRLPFAYPIYNEGYEKAYNRLDDWAGGLEGILTFGRQGLFAHDNTHHALAMAYAAVDCFDETGEFDRNLWAQYRAEFATHVVED